MALNAQGEFSGDLKLTVHIEVASPDNYGVTREVEVKLEQKLPATARLYDPHAERVIKNAISATVRECTEKAHEQLLAMGDQARGLHAELEREREADAAGRI